MINTKNVLSKMALVLNKEQLDILTAVLNDETKTIGTNEELIADFVKSKQYENCSAMTLKMYKREITLFNEWFKKSFDEVTKKDIESYIGHYRAEHEVSDTTANNMRRYISTFFGYLEHEDIICSNPVRKTKAIKTCKQVKKAFTDVEIEKMRINSSSYRDKVIFDTLYSTGVRVSELVQMNRADLKDGCAIVRGKGNKERYVYFTSVVWEELNSYLESRTDNCPALFITNRKERISKTRVEQIVRDTGRAHNIKAYPHKFRRTLASNMLNKGCPIQEVQTILGHSSIETTMIYCDINRDNIQYDHKKYC